MAKVVRKDKLQAGYDGNLESVKVYDNAGTNKVETSNGVFVVLEGLEIGEREVRKARLASEVDATKEVLFIHNAEVMYDERLYLLEEFVISANKVARAYRLFSGDVISLTVDLFDGAVAVGDKLIVKADGKLGNPAVAGDLATAKVVFEVIEDCGYELHTTTRAFAVSVERN
jgi:hypothetical protein